MPEQIGVLSPFDEWLWQLPEEVLARLDAASLAKQATNAGVHVPQLTFLTVICSDSEPAAEVLKSRAALTVIDSRSAQDRGLLWSRLGERDYVLAVVPASSAAVYHLIASVPVTDSRWRRVEESWLRAAAPQLASVILNEADFEAIGDSLARYGSVSVSRMAARVLRDDSSYTRGWKGKLSSRPSPRQALLEASGMMVRTLTMTVGNRLSIHLRRYAGATYYRGDYDLFCSVVLDRLSRAAAQRLVLLSGKQRKRQKPIRESLVMQLPSGTFGADTATANLLRSATSLRAVQVAVFHRNPYLHFAVTDYLDGSNFDVFVTEDDRLTVLPGYKASAGSLARVTDAIGETLGMIELRAESLEAAIPDREFFGVV